MTPSWRRLTAPGVAAVQIISLEALTPRIRDQLEVAFQAAVPGSGPLRYGWLHDMQGAPLDEILLETTPRGYLLHLHGGAVTAARVAEMLTAWGLPPATSQQPTGLETEILLALQQAPTDTAARAAASLFNDLPNVQGPGGLLETLAYGQSLFTTHRIVLAGAPNAGKSSLLNRLAGDERAIVSAQAGTTRDLVSVSLEIDGRLLTVIDGAGLREGGDELERSGQDLLRSAATAAASLWVVNPQAPLAPCPVENPIGLVLTHKDQGVGQEPAGGPLRRARTGLGDQGEEVRDLLRAWLP
ncbi:MAG: GTPase, partial [Dehalococcoidia bacterium]|nr:GTPase [Dehalococcoidia bacterium]